MQDDEALLRAWRGGDQAAGRALFARYFDELYGFFRNKLRGDVDDLVQRTLLACLEHAEDFRGEASFRSWVYAIARNELFGHWRREGRQVARHTTVDGGSEDPCVEDLSPGITDVMAEKQEQRLLLRALRRIPVDDLVAVELYYWRGLTGRELAAVWGVPEGTARTRLRRARLALEAKIEALAASPSECTSTLSGLDGWLASLAGAWRPPASA